MNDEIKEKMHKYETNLSPYAAKDSSFERLKDEVEDFRPAFFRDTDRIIYSFGYTRYLDKTQVFSFKNNDFISKRMTHVQLVSKIARTIGRALSLNEDLIEAIALGHDIGHSPLGHTGEKYLDEICKREKIGSFAHNVQSVRNLMIIDNNGKGSNLCVQTLDGILCHNGEIIDKEYYPKKKTKEEFLEDYNNSFKEDFNSKSLVPMTLEGCVVRISDLIGYLGRDIEDAIRLHLIELNDIPESLINTLGKNNREIVNTIVSDIIKNSYGKPYIKTSDEVFEAVNKLKDFNYEHIYYKAFTSEEKNKFRNMFYKLYDVYYKALINNDETNNIVKHFNEQSLEYQKEDKKRIVIDYIAGMTDDYLIEAYNLYKG